MTDVFLALGHSAHPAPPGPAQTSPADPAHARGTVNALDATVRVSEAQILALPVKAIVTSTDWTPVSRFEGPLLRDVLKLRTGPPADLEVFALNQYAVTIPWSDLEQFAPILAHTRDGMRMKRSDFGPMFIVYPRDQFKELDSAKMAARMAWQVCRINVR